MKQEDKELLLKDLSARLPYGVKVLNTTYKNHDIQTILGVVEDKIIMVEEYNSVRGDDFEYSSMTHYTGRIESVKPYLRPMSSMTEDENKERKQLGILCAINGNHERIFDGFGNESVDTQLKALDWLNAHHFDYRGLIEKGLAIMVTPDNNPYE